MGRGIFYENSRPRHTYCACSNDPYPLVRVFLQLSQQVFR